MTKTATTTFTGNYGEIDVDASGLARRAHHPIRRTFLMTDNPGMSLRDYFAAHFAVAMMTATSADSDFPNLDYQQEADGPTLAERVAAIAYRLADAKLKAWEAQRE